MTFGISLCFSDIDWMILLFLGKEDRREGNEDESTFDLLWFFIKLYRKGRRGRRACRSFSTLSFVRGPTRCRRNEFEFQIDSQSATHSTTYRATIVFKRRYTRSGLRLRVANRCAFAPYPCHLARYRLYRL